MKNKTCGFTLMEILLVAVLMSVIGIATANVFANGLKLWAKSGQVIRESDLIIFFDKMGRDIRNVNGIEGIAFKGLGTQLSFPNVITTQADARSTRSQEDFVDQIGAVLYQFDVATKKIYRSQANYSQALKGQWGNAVVVASGIEDVVLSYYYASGKGMQVKSLVDNEIPLGVSIDVRFEGDDYERRLHRYFPVIVGGGL